MKLLYCQDCRDFVTASRKDAPNPRSCQCGRHWVWWEARNVNKLHIYDAHGLFDRMPGAYVIAIGNPLIETREEKTTPETVAESLAGARRMPPGRSGRLLAELGCPIAKFRPGMSIDTAWAHALPNQKFQ